MKRVGEHPQEERENGEVDEERYYRAAERRRRGGGDLLDHARLADDQEDVEEAHGDSGVAQEDAAGRVVHVLYFAVHGEEHLVLLFVQAVPDEGHRNRPGADNIISRSLMEFLISFCGKG